MYLFNDSLSELEIALRPWSTFIRIVPKLAGNAHLLIPGKESIAISAYFASDIQKMEEIYTESIKEQSIKKDDITTNFLMKLISDDQQPSNTIELDGNYGNMQEFRDSFKHSVVFFIISSVEMQQDQLSRMDSVFMRLQRCLSNHMNNSNAHLNHMVSTCLIYLHPF